MAAKAAHLTATVYTSPTLFEILAQQSLASTIEPGFKKFLSFIISFNPERYGHVFKWEDECYLLFNLLLQRYYLKRHSASFSETFYGLKRITVDNSKFENSLSSKQQVLSLVSLVIIPYLENKIAQLSMKYQLDNADGHVPQKEWQKFFRKCLIRGHSILFVIYKSIVVYNYILYASEESMYPLPFLRLLRITLTYATPQPVYSLFDMFKRITDPSFTTVDSLDVLARTFASFLELSAFFLQFLSWWNKENHVTSIMNLPSPAPPKVSSKALTYKGICPICHKPQHIHTVLLVSGFVFCYKCIQKEVRKNKKCPVTLYPATEDDLVRLYIN